MRFLTAVVVFLGLAAASGAQEPQRFLATHGTLTETELTLVDGGVVVVKVLPASVKNELAILGTARIRATSEFFLRMYRYLMDYPRASLPGASDFLYWSMVDFGGEPTFRINHVTIYPIAQGENESVVIASKQLYFSHYFYTGLELVTLVKDREHPDDGFYLVALNRYRTDLAGGVFGKMARKVAEDSARGSTERYLKATQGAIEKYFRDERGR